MILELRQGGVPGTQIAKLYGVSKHEIYRRLKKFPAYFALCEKEAAERRERDNAMLTMLQDGYTPDDVVEVMEITKEAFDSWKHRKGIYTTRESKTAFDVERAWTEFLNGDSTHTLAERYKVDRIAIVRAFNRKDPRTYKEMAAKRKGGRRFGSRLKKKWDIKGAFDLFKEREESLRVLARLYHITPGGIRAAFMREYPEEYTRIATKRLNDYRAGVGKQYIRNRKPRKSSKQEPVRWWES